MASIDNIVLAATKSTASGNNWKITVNYDAKFGTFEHENFKFRDGFVVKEKDDGDTVEILTGVVGVDEFDPSGPVVHRTMTAMVNAVKLDTEDDAEDIFVQVRLRNLDLNILQTKNSKILLLNPQST
jgi:hypothetical protein